MSRLSFGFRLVTALALVITGVFVGPVVALAEKKPDVKAPAPEPVNIATVDGVKLKAIFYPSVAKSAATVIMLHPIGDKLGMNSPEWKSLAETLQKANYSVMTFDFRGHGESTSIDDKQLFWTHKVNQVNVRTKDPETIAVKDYIKQGNFYLPVLVNDIAAVRAYLDRRNDDMKDCNTSSLIVVGADSGATLGALWINSEWYRYKWTPNPMNPNINAGTLGSKPEGNDIIGAVFLTVSSKMGTQAVSVEKMLLSSCKERGMAAAFFYGKSDKAASNLNKNLELKLKTKNSKKHEFIGAVGLDTELTGIKMLQKSLETDKHIVDFLEGVVADRKEQRVDRNFLDTYYIWQLGAGRIPAKRQKGDKNLLFDDYFKFR